MSPNRKTVPEDKVARRRRAGVGGAGARLVLAACLLGCAPVALVRADEDDANRVTYVDDVRPIFTANCLGCHNPDRVASGLDLSTFRGALAGSSGGPVVKPGSPSDSPLLAVLRHERQPYMPPNGPKLDDATIETIRAWIEQGCYDTADRAAPRPRDDPALSNVGERAPLTVGEMSDTLPRGLPLAQIVTAERRGAVLSLAGHPATSLVAATGQKQVLLFDARRQELLGVLPFSPGFPETVRFSPNGELLGIGGGRGGQSGHVALHATADGRHVTDIGEEYDAVLAADVDLWHEHVALGGPGGVVKIHTTRDGVLEHRIEKHTEWITALAFSPAGVLLATADRNGGLYVWEAASHAPFYSLGGHGESITSLAWRSDGNVLASAGEDGQVRLWEMHQGRNIKTWTAHDGGVLAADFAPDGTFATAGRDRQVKLWTASGEAVRTLGRFDDVALSVAFCDRGALLVAGDLAGTIRVWETASGEALGDLEANPPPFEELRAAAREAADAADEHLAGKREALATARADEERLVADVAAAEQQVATAREALAADETAADAAKQAYATAVSEDQAAQSALAAAREATSRANEDVTAKMAELEQAIAADAAAQDELATAQQAARDTEAASDDQTKSRLDAAREAAAASSSAAEAAMTAARQAKTERDRLMQAETDARDALTALTSRQAATLTALEEAEAALATARDDLAARESELATLREQRTGVTGRVAEARQSFAQAQRAASRAAARRAKWEAGAVRAELDAARVALQQKQAEHQPLARAADDAREAAEAVAARLAATRSDLEDVTLLITLHREDAAAAEAALEDARAAHETAVRAAEQAGALVEDAAGLVARLEQIAQSAVDEAPLQQALQNARAAHAALQQELQAREQAVAAAAEGVNRAELDARAARETLVRAERQRSTLEGRVAALEGEAAAAGSAAEAAQAAAERAVPTVEAARTRVGELRTRYADLLDAATRPPRPADAPAPPGG